MKTPDQYNTIFKLVFDDPELSEFEVKVRRSFGLIEAAADMAYIDLEAVKAGRTRPEDLARQRALVDAFAGAIVSWNLDDDDGQPIPTDRETIRGRDILFVARIVAALMTYVNEESNALMEAATVSEDELKMDALA